MHISFCPNSNRPFDETGFGAELYIYVKAFDNSKINFFHYEIRFESFNYLQIDPKKI